MAQGGPVPRAFPRASCALVPALAILAPAFLPMLAGAPTSLSVAAVTRPAFTVLVPAFATTVPVTFAVPAFMPTALATFFSATPRRLAGRHGRAACIPSSEVEPVLVLSVMPLAVPAGTGAAV